MCSCPAHIGNGKATHNAKILLPSIERGKSEMFYSSIIITFGIASVYHSRCLIRCRNERKRKGENNEANERVTSLWIWLCLWHKMSVCTHDFVHSIVKSCSSLWAVKIHAYKDAPGASDDVNGLKANFSCDFSRVENVKHSNGSDALCEFIWRLRWESVSGTLLCRTRFVRWPRDKLLSTM